MCAEFTLEPTPELNVVPSRSRETASWRFGDGRRHHPADVMLAFWCAAPPGAQDGALCPEAVLPPALRRRLGVYLDVAIDWDEIADIVEDAYRVIAPKKLVAELDAEA